MEQDFHFTIRETAEATIVDMRGDLTKNAEQELLGRGWENGLDGGRKYLLLNFSGVPYINSAGIAVLIRLNRAGIKAGVATFAYGLSLHYQKLFRMVGLTEFMMIYPDEPSILQRIDELKSM
jgi:stage II sporulation protein AA (anti-sigma F factor antagonist)